MAQDLTVLYPGKIDTTDPTGYPYGKAQNITSPGDGTGTPWEKALVNDIVGSQQALLKSAGIVPSGTADKVGASQYLEAMSLLAAGGAAFFTNTGTPNAMVLTPITNRIFPPLFDGMEIAVRNIGTNTATVTLDYNGNVKPVVADGSFVAVPIGSISGGSMSWYRYEWSSARWVWTAKRAENIFLRDAGGYYTANNIEAALQELKPSRGAFTPTFKGSTVAGTGWAYFVQTGRWVRIGNLFFIDIRCQTTVGGGGISGTATGNLEIHGLPAGVTSGINQAAVAWSGITLQANRVDMTAQPMNGSLFFWQSSSVGAALTPVVMTDITGTSIEIRLHMIIEIV